MTVQQLVLGWLCLAICIARLILLIDLIEQPDEVRNSDPGTPSVLVDPGIVYIHVVEAVNVVLHQDDLALAPQFEQAKTHLKRLVSQAVILRYHEFTWW